MTETSQEPESARERLRVRSKLKTPNIKSFLLWTCLMLGIALSLPFALAAKDSEGVTRLTRKLLESPLYGSQPSWREKGLEVLYSLLVCYMFLGISIVCEHFLVSSLETISERLNLSADVAGATFMAAGSSAPELIASFVALANDHVSNEIEVGTIVGSAVFNTLVIIGLSAVYSECALTLDYRVLVRDCLFYALAIAGVIAVFRDGKIYWWEGFVSVFLYGLYILAMKFNATIMNLFPKSLRLQNVNRFNVNEDLENLSCEHLEASTSNEEKYYEREVNGNAAPLLPTTNDEERYMNATNHEQRDDKIGATQTVNQVDKAQEVEDEKSPFSVPRNKKERPVWLLSLPWSFLFYYTVPDCSKKNLERWYMVTFTISILWMTIISWFTVQLAEDLDSLLGIPSDVMGETVLTLGISMRSAIDAINNARDGKGDMAVANAIGSNVFGIWLGLGLPWLFVIPFIGESGSFGKYIEADNTKWLPSVAILFGVLAFYFFVICTCWTLNKRHGQLFMALCVIYALYHIVAVWALDIYHLDEDP